MVCALACLLVLATLGAAVAEPPGILQFMRGREERAWQTVEHRVLAFYYTWYGPVGDNGAGRHWGKTERRPL